MDGLAQGTASVMVDCNSETSSVMVYVCVFGVREAITFSLKKKDHIFLTGMPA